MRTIFVKKKLQILMAIFASASKMSIEGIKIRSKDDCIRSVWKYFHKTFGPGEIIRDSLLHLQGLLLCSFVLEELDASPVFIGIGISKRAFKLISQFPPTILLIQDISVLLRCPFCLFLLLADGCLHVNSRSDFTRWLDVVVFVVGLGEILCSFLHMLLQLTGKSFSRFRANFPGPIMTTTMALSLC